jgi:hypothetical protein
MAEVTRAALQATVTRLRARISQLRDRGEPVGEQDTKAALIDPVLAALGWDLEELDEVRREYRRKPQDNPVDYALFLLRSPRLFVEAKSLEKDLADRKWISQVLGYATVVGVRWCVLTNGDEYRLYNSHAAVDVEEKLFRTVRLSDPHQEPLCLETLELLSKNKMGILDALWQAYSVDQHVQKAVKELFDDQDPGLVRLVRKKVESLSPSDIRESLKRADVRVLFPAVHPQAAIVVDTGPEIVDATGLGWSPGRSPQMLGGQVSDLISSGLINPPLMLERTFKGVNLRATIEGDGKVTFDGVSYDSLSTAGGMARKSVIGTPEGRPYPQTNGWTFWRYREGETGAPQLMDVLRQRWLAGKDSR